MRHRVLLIAGLVVAACGGDAKVLSNHGPDDGDSGACEIGTERCACYGNKTCNDGLVCGSGLCVEVKEGGGGRSTSLDASLTPPEVDGASSGGRAGSAGARGAGGDGGTDADGSPGAGGGSGGSGGVKGSGGAGGGKGGGGAGGAKGGGGASGDDAGTALPVALFVMLDRSASMIQPPSGQTIDSWTSAVTAITAFVNDSMSRNVDIGLGSFPAGANNTFDCTDGKDCGTPIVPIAPVQTNAQLIINAMSAQRPQGLAFTPTECGLRGMINQCLLFMSNSVTGEPCVAVLVTDGAATQCDIDNNNLIKLIADGKAKGVDSFTLGLPGADIGVLNQYAAAGGTGMAIDVSAGPGAFIAALKAIRGRVTHTMSP